MFPCDECHEFRAVPAKVRSVVNILVMGRLIIIGLNYPPETPGVEFYGALICYVLAVYALLTSSSAVSESWLNCCA